MERFSIGSKYTYCPNGNYWQDISGVFDKRLYLFCDCTKCKGKVYELRPIEVTAKVGKEVVEDARKRNEVDQQRSKITFKNLEEVKKRLNNLTC